MSYKKISDEQYFSDILSTGAISFSGLKKFDISPLHFKTRDDEMSDEMILGILVHLAVLEADKFNDRVFVGYKRSAAEKELYAQAIRENKIHATESKVNHAKEIAASVLNNDKAKLLLTGAIEEAGFAVCPQTGVMLKIKPDVRLDGLKLLVDLKTCASGMSDRDLERRMVNLKYHWQSSFYCYVNKLITGEDYKFVHMFVEKEAPYSVRFRALSTEAMDKGFNEWFPLLEKYKECLATNNWPGFDQEIKEINLPAWAMGDSL